MNYIQNRVFEKFEADVRQGKEYTKLGSNEFPIPESDVDPLLPDERYFGEFECEQCERGWKSGNSWFGFGQNCENCNQMTYPCKLEELDCSDLGGVEGKPHVQARCERCKEFGRLCRDSEGVKLGNQKNPVSRDWKSKSKSKSKSSSKSNAGTAIAMAIQNDGFSYLVGTSYLTNPTNRSNSSTNSAQNPLIVYTNSNNRISNPNYVNPSVSFSSMASRAVPKPVINRRRQQQQQQTVSQQESSLLSSNTTNSNESLNYSNSTSNQNHRSSITNSWGHQLRNFVFIFMKILIVLIVLFILWIIISTS